jgi:hypothetical protein
MDRERSTWLVSLTAMAVLLGLGFWLGYFEWFGGYILRQRAFVSVGFALAMFGSLIWLRSARLKWLKVFVSVVVLLAMLEVGFDLGQAFYVGPNSASELAHLFVAALGREL